MSISHSTPRQDRRQGKPRAVVRAHAGLASVGHDQGKVINDPSNGETGDGQGNPTPEGASAPGANGAAETA
jgi:hypothetical protein